MVKRILSAILCAAAVCAMCACAPEEQEPTQENSEQTALPAATTSMIGGFVVYDSPDDGGDFQVEVLE